MDALDKLLISSSSDDWLAALPKYQSIRLQELLEDSSEYMDVAEKWLTARLEQTEPFGAVGNRSVYKDRIWEEIEKLLCGNPGYEEQRRKLFEQKPLLHGYVIVAISTALEPVIGISGVLLAPVVALILASIGKISLNAWCSGRKELSQSKEK